MAISHKRVVAYLAEHPGPIRVRDLASALQIPKSEWTELRKLLRRLQAPQHLKSATSRHPISKKRTHKSDSHLVSGRVQGTRRGFAFLIRDDGKDDIYISSANLRDAVHGDSVQARLQRTRGRMEGVVEEVSKRARRVLAGTLLADAGRWYLSPDDDRVGRDLLLSNPQKQPDKAQAGHKALARITGSDGKGHTFAELVEVLGPADAPGVRMYALRAEFSLPDAFPEVVLREVASFKPPTEEQLQQREDFSMLRTFTIDPHDAKDHDDAVSLQRRPQGGFELGVHIADVAQYVQLGSALDGEALERGTSVYLADTVVPMLPEALSNHLCSLRPGVARLTRSAILQFDVDANLLDWRLSSSWIVSRAKLSYQAAQAIVDGTELEEGHTATFEPGPGEDQAHSQATAWKELLPELKQDLGDMAFLASRLRGKRFKKGALALETPEIVLQHDELGRVLNVRVKQSLQSYSWIEEFMLMANQVVARSLAAAHLPLLWRVHENPRLQGVEELRRFLHKLGIQWKPEEPVSHRDYQQLIKVIETRPEKRYLMYRILRSLQKARYDARHHGHYGLAFNQYTHFTSPIRRYPDLHNHRLVGVFIEHGQNSSRFLPKGTPTASSAHQLGESLSAREASATDAERASIKLRVCEYLVSHLGEEADGFISGVTEFGIFIDIPEWGAEGLIHVENLKDDHYSSDPEHTQLRGDVSGRTFRFGQRLRVCLVRVDPDRRQIDLGLAS